MSTITNKEKNFVGFEYKEITLKKTMKSVYLDSYMSFGWILEGKSNPVGKVDYITLKYKRNRKIRNKAELTRLQRQFDAYVGEILKLESSKKIKAATVAYIVGVIGTAFMTVSVFAVTAGHMNVSIAAAIPGVLGWIFPYLIFKSISEKKTEMVNPLICQKYEALYSVCEKANALLD